MSEPFIGEVKMVAFGFPPKGWALCDGQLLAIVQNQALFSLLGTMYGGDGRTTFALPNLQARTPLHFNASFPQGSSGGEAFHTLTTNELPAHNHQVNAFNQSADTPTVAGHIWATNNFAAYGTNATTSMNAGAINPTGGGQPHENRPPFLTLSFVIALQGIFPSRS